MILLPGVHKKIWPTGGHITYFLNLLPHGRGGGVYTLKIYWRITDGSKSVKADKETAMIH